MGRKLRESLGEHAYSTIRFAANADYLIACHEQAGSLALFSYSDARLLGHIVAHDWNQSIISAMTSWQWSPDAQWLITTGFMERKSVENWVEHDLTERWDHVPLPADAAQQDFGWTASLGLAATLWHIIL